MQGLWYNNIKFRALTLTTDLRKQKSILIGLLTIALLASLADFAVLPASAQSEPCQGQLFWYNDNDEPIDPSNAKPGDSYTAMASFDNCRPGDTAVLTNAKDGSKFEVKVDDTGYAVIETNGQFSDSGKYFDLQVKNPQQQLMFSRSTGAIQLASSEENGQNPRDESTNNQNNNNNNNLQETGFENICSKPDSEGKGGLAQCVQRLYLFALGFGGFVAFAMIVLAGYRYMTAAGNSSQVEGAKEAFASAFIGLIIIFVAFILLNLINPDLVRFPEFKDLTLRTIPTGISIVSPSGGAKFDAGADIQLQAKLSGTDNSTVSKVSFRVDDKEVTTAKGPDYKTKTNKIDASGEHRIVAVALDSSQKELAKSAAVLITINPASGGPGGGGGGGNPSVGNCKPQLYWKVPGQGDQGDIQVQVGATGYQIEAQFNGCKGAEAVLQLFRPKTGQLDLGSKNINTDNTDFLRKPISFTEEGVYEGVLQVFLNNKSQRYKVTANVRSGGGQPTNTVTQTVKLAGSTYERYGCVYSVKLSTNYESLTSLDSPLTITAELTGKDPNGIPGGCVRGRDSGTLEILVNGSSVLRNSQIHLTGTQESVSAKESLTKAFKELSGGQKKITVEAVAKLTRFSASAQAKSDTIEITLP